MILSFPVFKVVYPIIPWKFSILKRIVNLLSDEIFASENHTGPADGSFGWGWKVWVSLPWIEHSDVVLGGSN